MADDDGDSGGIIPDFVGDIAESAADAGGGILGELKKFGQAATSQVTGSRPQAETTSGSHKKTTAKRTGSEDGDSIFGELKKFGQAATGQITGHEDAQSENLAAMKKTDDEFSDRESEIIKARIKQIYQEYAAKKANEKKKEEVEQQRAQQGQEQLTQVKKKEFVNSAIQKTRAEIKNYGAE